MKLQGKLTISRASSNRDETDTIVIRLNDNLSGVEFVEVSMTPEAFAIALTGLARQECEFALGGLDVVGKTKQVKTEVIPAPENLHRLTNEQKREYLSKWEVDGWQVWSLKDLGNHHRQTGNGYNVTFARWVEEAGESDD